MPTQSIDEAWEALQETPFADISALRRAIAYRPEMKGGTVGSGLMGMLTGNTDQDVAATIRLMEQQRALRNYRNIIQQMPGGVEALRRAGMGIEPSRSKTGSAQRNLIDLLSI